MASCKNILHAETSDKITECKTSDGAKTYIPMASVRPETSSDTIVEVNTKRETEDGTSTINIDSEKNAKPLPPPLENVSSAQELPSKMGAIKTPTSAPPVTPGLLNRRKFKERKIGHRRVDEEGQITFKKIYTSQIQGSISLGISHAVGRLASKPERDLLMEDFTIVETTTFPRDGSNITPAHHFSDFKFKSYAPVAFRYFRDLFGILPSDFLLSLCNNEMIELTNPGASGSIFYLTEDDEFILKTIQHKEAEFLQKLLPGYYMNLNFNPRTLLPKFFGLYCYQCGGKNVRLVVMNNLLPTSCRLHEKYDLKGSSYKRKASKSERKKYSPTFKDLDFLERHPEGIYLEPDTYKALTNTIHRDCRVLQSFKIMDYSLLVGIHNIDLAKKEKMEEKRKEEEDGFGKASDESESASPIQASSARSDTCLVRSKSINRQRLAAFSTAMESIQAEVEAVDQDYDVPPGGIPAKNSKGEHLLLFLGIIDILQSYRLKKRMEHAWKSMLHDGDTVSVHRPSFYAERFEKFMAKTVFKKSPASAGQHRKFKTVVSSVLALKHSPSKRKGVSQKHDPSSTAESGISHSHLPKISSESESTQKEETIAASVPCSSKYPDVYSTKISCEITNTSQISTNDKEKSRANTDPVPPKMMPKTIGKTATSSLEVRSLSHGNIQTESVHDCASEASSTSTSGLSSTLHTVSWTPPHSVEGSTPTHTEGTPSFTESSSSGDAACPTTPVKSINKSSDSLPPLGETQILQDSEMIKKV